MITFTIILFTLSLIQYIYYYCFCDRCFTGNHVLLHLSLQLYKLFIRLEYSTIISLYLFVFLTYFFLLNSFIIITDKLFFCDKRHESIILNVIFILCYYMRVGRKMICLEEKNSKKKLKYYKNKILVWSRV
jgi:hypothetical protein